MRQVDLLLFTQNLHHASKIIAIMETNTFIPIERVERWLRRSLFFVWLVAASGMVLIGAIVPERYRLGILVGFFALLIIAGVVAAFLMGEPKCPYCQADFRRNPATVHLSRLKFPHGWATICHVCSNDLSKPFDPTDDKRRATRPPTPPPPSARL